jgi:DNA-binding CsgD family transcriptional regulator
MALLALSHTRAEHALYKLLLAESERSATEFVGLSLRRLLELTGFNSYSTLRRARHGLVQKLSIDCEKSVPGGGDCNDATPSPTHLRYRPYRPAEVFARRLSGGREPYPKEHRGHASQSGFSGAMERVAGGYNLSRREAQVALCCAEGLTNCEIGECLFITEQTVKFHLRHVFAKFGVRRRAQLIALLLAQPDG